MKPVQAHRHRLASGFTLIELLVVVVVAGVIATVVGLSTIGGGQRDPATQADRLALRIQAQCDRAVQGSRLIGLRLHARGFDFWQRAPDDWRRLESSPLASGTWPEGTRIAARLDGQAMRIRNAPAAPQVLCSPVGELTPFALRISRHGRDVDLAMDAFARRLAAEG